VSSMPNRATMSSVAATAVLLLGAFLWTGCDRSPSGSVAAESSVGVTLGVSSPVGEIGAPIEVTAVAWNRTQTPVFYFDGCSFIDGVIFELFGADGTQIYISNPPALGMLCPELRQALGEGDQLVAKFTFQGTFYTSQGSAYEAPSGTYTIRVRFVWSTDLTGYPAYESMAESSFRWKATSD